MGNPPNLEAAKSALFEKWLGAGKDFSMSHGCTPASCKNYSISVHACANKSTQAFTFACARMPKGSMLRARRATLIAKSHIGTLVPWSGCDASICVMFAQWLV